MNGLVTKIIRGALIDKNSDLSYIHLQLIGRYFFKKNYHGVRLACTDTN